MTILNKTINVQNPKTIIRDLGLGDYKFQKVENLSSDGKRINRFHVEAVNGISKYPLDKNKTVDEGFVLTQPNEIQEIVNILVEKNPGLRLITANNCNHGRQIDIQLSFPEEYIIKSDIDGIRDVIPTLFMTFNVHSVVKFIFSTVQLFCSNQIPTLKNDPLNKLIELNKRKSVLEQIYEQSFTFDKLHELMKNKVEELESFSSIPCSDENFENYAEYIYDFNYNKEGKLTKKSNELKERLNHIYYNAPNALPGTLLGSFNAVTNECATRKYKTDSWLSKLPTSKPYYTTQKALRVCKEIKRLEQAQSGYGWSLLN